MSVLRSYGARKNNLTTGAIDIWLLRSQATVRIETNQT